MQKEETAAAADEDTGAQIAPIVTTGEEKEDPILDRCIVLINKETSEKTEVLVQLSC